MFAHRKVQDMVDLTTPKRSPKRSPLFLRGRLKCGADAQEVRIRDVSVDGALVDVSHSLPADQEVILVCGHSCLRGRIACADEGRVGIEFLEPLAGETLVDSLQQGMKVSAPRRYLEGKIQGATK
jgi:FKBP-type peptidyl-prolyl cis-trans isomerase 2